jgi:hypothetical protein
MPNTRSREEKRVYLYIYRETSPLRGNDRTENRVGESAQLSAPEQIFVTLVYAIPAPYFVAGAAFFFSFRRMSSDRVVPLRRMDRGYPLERTRRIRV